MLTFIYLFCVLLFCAFSLAQSSFESTLNSNELSSLKNTTLSHGLPAKKRCSYQLKAGDSINKILHGLSKRLKRRTFICLSEGVYTEKVIINVDNVELIGQGADKTVITFDDSLSKEKNVFLAATLYVQANNFMARDLMIQNSNLSTTDPSPAVSIDGENSNWRGVALVSWDDTLAIVSGRHLFKWCFIAGITDVTWGYGRAAFFKSTIYIRKFPNSGKGHISTFGTEEPFSKGYEAGALYQNCRIEGEGQTHLGRPYRDSAMAIWVNCYVQKDVVLSESLYENMRSYRYTNQDYYAYNLYGPGWNPKLNNGNLPAKMNFRDFLSLKNYKDAI